MYMQNLSDLTKKIFKSKEAVKDGLITWYKENPGRLEGERNGCIQMLKAVQNKKELSIDLIKEIHLNNCSPITTDKELKPGKIRDVVMALPPKARYGAPGDYKPQEETAGAMAEKGTGVMTEAGVKEIIQQIINENKENYYRGSVLLPTVVAQYGNQASDKYQNYKFGYNNIKEKLKEYDDNIDKLAKAIMELHKERSFTLFVPRKKLEKETVPQFIENKLQELINNFNVRLAKAKNAEEKLNCIVLFIQQCLRLHVFNDGNHRVFAKDLFNLLLLKAGIGFCTLTSFRGIFIFKGLNETIDEVKKHVTFFNKNDNQEKFIADLIKHLEKIKTIKDLEENEVEKAEEPKNIPAPGNLNQKQTIDDKKDAKEIKPEPEELKKKEEKINKDQKELLKQKLEKPKDIVNKNPAPSNLNQKQTINDKDAKEIKPKPKKEEPKSNKSIFAAISFWFSMGIASVFTVGAIAAFVCSCIFPQVLGVLLTVMLGCTIGAFVSGIIGFACDLARYKLNNTGVCASFIHCFSGLGSSIPKTVPNYDPAQNLIDSNSNNKKNSPNL